MQCSDARVACIAAEPRNEAERSARDVANAVLFREILKPLARGLGPVGESAVDAVADALIPRLRR